MRCITIIQPFAHLIAIGEKRVENRTWYTPYRGPIAIHAGKAKRYGNQPVAELAEYYDVDPAAMAFGAVVAIADLIACVSIEAVHDGKLPEELRWLMKHRHMEGPFGFVLDNVRPLAAPIPCKGELGLWNWTPAAELVFAPPAVAHHAGLLPTV